MLLGAGASLGLAVWAAVQGDALVMYLVANDRGAVAFGALLPSVVAGAWIVLVGAFLLARSAEAGQRAPTFCLWALRCQPLLWSALLPPLWRWQAWAALPLGFLGLLAVLALGLRLSLTRALFARSANDAVAQVSDGTAARLLPRLYVLSSARTPLVVVLVAAAAYCAYFGHHSVQNHHNLGTNSYDLGIFDNILWNTADRHSLSLPSSPYGGPDARHLGQHATFIAFLIAPLYALAPRAETALWIQSAFIALAALPLFLLARRRIGAWSACLIALGYLLYPLVHGPNLYDFHFITMTPFFIWTSVVLLEARRDWLAALALACCLLIREDAAAGVAMVGAYLIMTRQRPRVGLLLGAIGGSYVLVMKLLIMPGGLGNAGSFVQIYRGLLPKGADGFGAVVSTVLANPAFAFKTLLTADKLVYALQIAAPLAFLPWLRPLGWVCSLPGVLFCLLVTHAAPLIEISFQYTPHWTTYLFLALIVNVEWLEQSAEVAAQGAARKRAALATFALCILLGSHQFGAILQQNTARAGYNAFVFGTTKAQQADYAALRALIAEVPKDARIVASENIVPHVSNRRYAYTLRIGVFDADYLLAPTDSTLPEERKRLQSELRGHKFGVFDARGRFVLMRRGADPARNAAVLRTLH